MEENDITEEPEKKKASWLTVTQEDRDLINKVYPRKGGWTDEEIEMVKALGHL
jgi:hypothetical protein